MFNVGPRDPATYAVVVVLSLVALAATLIPAGAAMRTDPVEALRCE
jgi:ABC-type lipoprotein release transport system permease subunit